MKTRTKQVLLALAALLLVFAVLAGTKGAQIWSMLQAGKSFEPPPEAVTTATVGSERWRSFIAAIGSVHPVMGVTLTAEVPGTVREIRFSSGQQVKKGELLLRMDTSTEQAELAAARADARLARTELARVKTLVETSASSQADLDAATAQAARAKAQVRNVEAIISKKNLRAPFSGRLGIRRVDLGQFLEPGTAIVALNALHPAYVDFRVPQQALAKIRVGLEVEIRSDTFVDRQWSGTIESIDVQVDPSTRNVLVRARVDNEDGSLRPGMFVNVEVALPDLRDVLVIPETAVLYAPYGDSVFVVRGDDKAGSEQALTVEQVFVRLGERRGDFRVVTSGLEAGQTIVSTGAFKLRHGSPILVDNALAPTLSANPTPENQ